MKTNNRILKIAAFFLLLTVILSAAPTAAPVGAAVGEQTGITVMLSENGRYIDVRCTFDGELLNESTDKTLYLMELRPEDAASDASRLTPVIADIRPESELVLHLSLIDGTRTRLYSSFLLAERTVTEVVIPPQTGAETTEDITSESEPVTEPTVEQVVTYTPICTPKYIENAHTLATLTYAYPQTVSKKGVDIQLMSDAQETGTAHTVVTVALNEYLTDSADEVYSASEGGRTVYFDSARMNLLDHKLKVLTEAGIHVYINLVLSAKTQSTPRAAQCLYFPSASSDAQYYAINTSCSDGSLTLRAAMSFFVTRYTLQSGKYGFAGSYIIGYEVNSNRNTNNAGPMTLAEYTDEYCKTFRTALYAAQSIYSGVRLYISIGNNFTVPSSSGTPDSMLDYSASDFLQLFNARLKEGGNLPWGVCINPYNIDRSSPAFWTETRATDGEDTEYITMKNISVLTRLLSSSDFMYAEARRFVVIGSLGYSSGRNSSGEQSRQAAAYAYAYYIAQANDSVEAIIYCRQTDSASDAGLNYGLYTKKDGTSQTPFEKKSIYKVYKYIDTEHSRENTAFALPVIGATSWSELVTGYNSSAQSKRTLLEGISVDDGDVRGGLTSSLLFDFSTGVCGFYPSDNTFSVTSETQESGEALLHAVMYNVDYGEYRGISRSFADGEMSAAEYISFNLTPQGPEEAQYVNVMLRLLGRDADGAPVVFEGIAQIRTGEQTRLNYRVADFFDKTGGDIDTLKFWLKPYSEAYSGEYEMYLSDICALATVKPGAGEVVRIIVIIILSAAALTAMVLLLLYFRALCGAKNKKRSAPAHTVTDDRTVPHRRGTARVRKPPQRTAVRKKTDDKTKKDK